MRFRTGYAVTIPIDELAGAGGQLRILFRIVPVGAAADEFHFADGFSVPPIEKGVKGVASVRGEFLLGPGQYRVDWMMRDRKERICADSWTAHAELHRSEMEFSLGLPPDHASQTSRDPFEEQSQVERVREDSTFHVRILVNLSPPDPSQSMLHDRDVRAIVSMLRGIARQPRIDRFSLVAFTVSPEKIVYEAENRPRIDFPELGEAVTATETGTVEYRHLHDPASEARFLAMLLTEPLSPGHPQPDALIIVGPKLMLERNVPRDVLLAAGSPRFPIFYLNYNERPTSNPWRDAISAAIKVFRGLEYSVSTPRDFGKALRDIMSHLPSRHTQ